MGLGRCLFVVFTVAAVAGGGCGGSSPRPEPPPVVSAELFPLSPGTLWVYQVRESDGQVTLQRVLVRGPFYLKSVEAPGTVVDESGGVSGELSLDVEWHPVVYYRRGDFLYKFSGLNYVDQELREYRLGLGEEKVLPSDPFRYPAWENDFEIFHVDAENGYGIRTYSIAEEDPEPVRVGAGTFLNCLRVETKSVASGRTNRSRRREIVYRYIDWYAPGVGMVKSVVEVDDPPRAVRRSELVSFRAGENSDGAFSGDH